MSERYAEGTDVPVDRSQSEIRKIILKYGADEYVYGEKAGKAMIGFTAKGKQVRFILPFPDPNDPEFSKTPTGRTRKGNASNEAYEAEIRRRWRALSLSIKGKFEAVATGIVFFEEEFLPYFVLPNGMTVAETMLPQLEAAYQSKRMPKLLPEV